MKYTLHVPVEQYGFVAAEVDAPELHKTSQETGLSSTDLIAGFYKEISESFKPQPVNKMPDAQWRELYDKVRRGDEIKEDPGIFDQLSPQQSFAIKELMRSKSRERYANR